MLISHRLPESDARAFQISRWFTKVSYYLSSIHFLYPRQSGRRPFLKYQIISISLRYSISVSPVQRYRKASNYFWFPFTFFFHESGSLCQGVNISVFLRFFIKLLSVRLLYVWICNITLLCLSILAVWRKARA